MQRECAASSGQPISGASDASPAAEAPRADERCGDGQARLNVGCGRAPRWYHEAVMAQPRPTPEPVVVPEALKPLVEQLAKLQPGDRDLVVRAAESSPRCRAVTWELLEAARGVVSLGGDAVEDCKALYDG